MLKWEPAADRRRWPLSDPRFSNLSQDEEEVLLWSEELGWICSCLFPSPTHLSHTTNINPFENKVWEIYLYKEVCLFVHWSQHYCWLCFCIYLYMYVAIQHWEWGQWRGTMHSQTPALQDPYRLLNVIFKTLVDRGLNPLQRYSRVYSTAQANWFHYLFIWRTQIRFS